MYLPKHTEETRLDVLHALIAAHPFATLVTSGADGPVVNHLPFMIDTENSEFGVLRGHVARANPVWKDLADQAASIAVFQGPQAYISPNWYPSKHEHGKAVPTWNYAVVHAHGIPRVIEDPQWLVQHVTQLSDQHEAAQKLPWQVSDAPPDYIERMIGMIVGIEIPITRIVGKWKLNQHRTRADQLGMVAGLTAGADDRAHALADLMLRNIDTPLSK